MPVKQEPNIYEELRERLRSARHVFVLTGAGVSAESGLSTPDDLSNCAKAGVTTFLIGESLMRRADVAAATRELIGTGHE